MAPVATYLGRYLYRRLFHRLPHSLRISIEGLLEPAVHNKLAKANNYNTREDEETSACQHQKYNHVLRFFVKSRDLTSVLLSSKLICCQELQLRLFQARIASLSVINHFLGAQAIQRVTHRDFTCW